MFTAQCLKDIAHSLLKLYHHALAGDADVDDIRRWLDLGEDAVKQTSELARSNLSAADKQKLQAAVALTKSILRLLRNHHVGFGLGEQASVSWDDVEAAFDNRIKTGVITNQKHLDLKSFLKDAKQQFISQVHRSLEEHSSLKVNTVLAAEYVIKKDDEETTDVKYFNTKSAPIYSTTDPNEWFAANVEQPVDTDMEEFQEQDSGWSLRSILHLTVNINKFNPMRGSSYIDLPDFVKKKKACVNVINNDEQCFKWAILSALHPVAKNTNRVSSYAAHSDSYNFSGIEFPVDPKQVGRFEKQNDISVNVYFLKKKGNSYNVLPRHLSEQKKVQHVNLLLVENYYVDENEEVENKLDDFDVVHKFHYVWIKNLSRLVRSQLTARQNKIHICDRCLHFFRTSERLAEHAVDCEKVNHCKIILPEKKDSVLRFQHFAHQVRVPIVVYADFECLLRPVNNDKRAYQLHEAFSVGYFVRYSFNDARSKYESYRQNKEGDESPATWFVKKLRILAFELQEIYENPRSMRDLTLREMVEFERAVKCHICNKPFTEADKKVRDHCHFTGE